MSRFPNSDTGFYGRAQLVALANVGLERDDATTKILHNVRRFIEVFRRGERIKVGLDLLANVDRDNVSSFLRHADRVCAALAPCRTSDERDLAVETVAHRTSIHPDSVG